MAKCNLFFSGVHSYRKFLDARGITGFNELISYFDIKRGTIKNPFDYINKLLEVRNLVMIDSGAYSAWNSGGSVDLKEFVVWHKQLAKECPSDRLVKVGLDHIGVWENSKANQIVTDGEGLDLFPTFHRQDPQEYLDWIMGTGHTLMGLGGNTEGALAEPDKITNFLHSVFGQICDKDGHPKIRTHLFGITNVNVMQTFPAWSNDSASAMFTGSYGALLIPMTDPITMQPDWTQPSVRVLVSDQSNKRAELNSHFDTLRKPYQEWIREFYKNLGTGYTIEGLASDHNERKCAATELMFLQSQHYPEDLCYKPKPCDHDLFEGM